MAKNYEAYIRLGLTVEFTDSGEMARKDQAMEKLLEKTELTESDVDLAEVLTITETD